ncbi:MAG: 23S rRNA (uracil(1939)-C(5))-methyltransferase RlmD [bacterium]|nr:23S rRNA (uracil(1939)-C(5))-methyltransferase RlmD [bacterium]
MFKIGDVLKNIKIISIAGGGDGIARADGIVIFVKYAASGDMLDLKITEVSKKFLRADILKINTLSSDRTSPLCEYYSKCGGCNFMHLMYDSQLEYKKNIIKDALWKIAKIKEGDYFWEGILASPHKFYYRNKLQVPVSGDKIGFYAPKSHDIINIDTCLIQSKIFTDILNKFRTLETKNFRYICMRTNHKNDILLTFVIRKTLDIPLTLLEIDNIKGILLNLNDDLKNNFVFSSASFKLVYGMPYIIEKLADVKYKISANSFFQINTGVGEALYEYLKLQIKNETVLDLYCGSGGISLFIADSAKKVIGIEVIKEAVLNARESIKINNIKNVEFLEGTVEENLARLKFSKSNKIDSLILNPPRKGAGDKVIDEILKIAPMKIIYVSCNPATLARDLRMLQEADYSIRTVRAFDMFPQTSNVETVVCLNRLKNI